jgi:SAM-dependent methyltransferase
MTLTIIDRVLAFGKRWAGRRFDRRLGIETNKRVSRQGLNGMPTELREHAGEYAPTNPALFRRTIRKSGIDPKGFTFIDLGCGKGRVIIAAAEYPFTKIIGVEADIALCRVAKQNLKRWREGRSDGRLQIVHEDARTFKWPKGDLFVFMYSPFTGPVFQQVAERLAAAAGEPGRAVVIAYSADWEAEALERAGCFTRVRLRRRKFWAASTVSFFYNDLANRMRR